MPMGALNPPTFVFTNTLFAVLFTLFLLPSLALGSAHHVYNWELKADQIAPDGFTRSATLVEGQFPGPLLSANKGDSVVVNVQNSLADPTMRRSTSIHWHGLFQARNAYNDGPSFITQCPISPNHSYPYTLSLGTQTGTFWYHSHLSTQYVDGIRGPMVIYDPDDPYRSMYDVDDESTILTLADWYHKPAPVLADAWFAGGSEPVPDSALLNGVGRSGNGPAVNRSRVSVTPGKRYRFRIVSISAEGTFQFSIEKHSLTIIEADGILHEPYVVDSIPVLPGQRYSVVVNANQTIDNYWISYTQLILGKTTSAENTNFNGQDSYAIFHYHGAPCHDEPTRPPPTSLPAGAIAFQEYNLKPLINPGAPGGSGPADKTLQLTYKPTASNGDRWTINDVAWHPPSVPTLLQILSGARNASDFNATDQAFVLPRNSIIDVELIGGPGHAFHLHGHAFDVIQSASGGPPNYVNPPRRDVVASGGTSTNPLKIRFKTDNAGPWFMHCHIDWHMDAGLAAVFVEDPEGECDGHQSLEPTKDWQDLCGIYNALDPDLQ